MPYYSIPSQEKSAVQEYQGEEMPFEDVGFAFNKYFIDELLRNKMGFKGYINSDSGILDNMAWGVEDLTRSQRAAKAINAGVDLISDTNEVHIIKTAYEEGLISMERINEACIRLLSEMFDLGLFDDKTYVDVEEATTVVRNKESWDKAYEAHQKSVVLLKNKDKILPLAKGTKVFAKVFAKEEQTAELYQNELDNLLKESKHLTPVDTIEDAEVAIAFLYPKSGNYFTATPGLLELGLVEKQINKAVDGSEYEETTISNLGELEEMKEKIKAKGGKFITTVNVTLPWLLDSIEPDSDGLLCHFDTFLKAQLDIITGEKEPVGKLPITLPKDESVIAVDEDGNCVSRNDVPGYDKDLYMPEGMTYAYIDEVGNEYKYGFGLGY